MTRAPRLARATLPAGWAIAVALLALTLRLAAIGWTNAPPTGDGPLYDDLAVNLLNGDGFARPGGPPTAWITPGYPIFLAGVYAVAGHSYDAVRVAHAGLWALACVLVAWIGARLGYRGAGLLAGLACAVHPFFIAASQLIFSETLFVALLLACMACWVRFLERDRLRDLAAAAACCAAAVMVRSALALFPGVIALWLIARRRGPRPALARQLAVWLAICALPIALWAWRNARVFHAFVPLGTQAGDVLYVSYHPVRGKVLGMRDDHDPVMREAIARFPKGPLEVQRSRFLAAATRRSIVEHPERLPYLLFLKAATFWSVFDWEVLGQGAFNVGTALLLPWIVLGAWQLGRHDRRALAVTMVPAAYMFAMGLIFYGLPRFRLTVEPFLALAACAGLWWLWRRQERRAAVAAGVGAWSAVAVLLALHGPAVKDASRALLQQLRLW